MSTKQPQRVIPKVDACIDCGGCNVICKETWEIPENSDRIAVVTNNEGVGGGRFQEGETSVPMSCYHCAEAPCMEVCPTDAIDRDEQGLVQVDSDACIGCSYCSWACPFGATQFPDESEATGSAGVMDKCTGCAPLTAEGENPACVDHCPTDALAFGTPAEIATELRDDRSDDLFGGDLGAVVFGDMG